MESFLSIIHYLLCILLIGSILLQAGKGADIGATFGAGSSQTLFGPRGAATILTKVTSILALAFLCTSLGLVTYAKSRANRSVFDKIPVTQVETAPAETLPVTTSPESKPTH